MENKESKAQTTGIDRFSAIFEQSPLSIQIFSPEGFTIRVNKAWETLWGVTAEQILGYNILEDPQLIEKGIMPFIKRGFAGEVVQIPPVFYDPEETIPDITKNQEPQRWTTAVIFPLKDTEGNLQEVGLIHEDITEFKKIEEETSRLTRRSKRRENIFRNLSPMFRALSGKRGANRMKKISGLILSVIMSNRCSATRSKNGFRHRIFG